MSTIDSKGPFWWDRELDPTGKIIRPDVRSAAREIWHDACSRTRALLGDVCDAAALMERSVGQISRYLNRRGTPLFAPGTSSLLTFSFCRALRRHAAKLRRLELADDISALAKPGPTRNCTKEEDCRMDAEKAARQLTQRGRRMYELRSAGFEWKEIAKLLTTTDAAARAEFSRDLKRARLKLNKKYQSRAKSRDESGSTGRGERSS